MKDDHKTKKQLMQELTELRSQNAALRESTTRIIPDGFAAEEAGRYAESIAETVREPLLILDADLKIISANRNFYRTFKTVPGETIGSLIYDLGIKQWDIPELRKLLEEVPPEKKAFDDSEIGHDFKDVGSKIMLLNAREINQKYASANMILLALEDIAEPQRLKNLLADSEERYRRLFETASDGILLLEKREGKITHANPAAEEMLGYSATEIMGNELKDIGVELDIIDFPTLIQDLNSKGILHYNDVRVTTRSGQPVDTDIYLVDKSRLVQCNIRDITDRKRTEAALRLSEERYRWILDNMADVIAVMDMNLGFTYLSPSIARVWGYTVEEAMAQTFAQTMTPESLQITAEVFDEEMRLEAGGSANPDRIRIVEVEQYKKDGSVVLTENHLSFLRDEARTPVGIISVSHDITERKRAEEDLRKSEERLKDIIFSIADWVWEVDEHGVYTYSSQKGIDLFGKSSGDVIGKTPFDFMPPDEARRVAAIFSEIAVNKAPIKDLENWNITGNGERICLLTNGVAILDKEGNLRGYRGVDKDITERKRAEDALKISEKTYRLLADNVHDVIFVLDMNLNYTYVSPSVKILRGYEPEEVMKHPANETLTPSSRDLAAKTLSDAMELEQAGHKQIPESLTVRLEMMRKDGSTVWTEVKLSFLRDENRRPVGILGVTRDLTERMQAEKELEETIESLRRAISTTIQVLASAVNAKDPYTAGHQMRSADLARAIAAEMGLPPEKIEGIRMAGSIHDIGKLSIPLEILSKPAKLTNIEFALVKEHARIGYEILKDVESPWPLAEIACQHHERMDGSGYPGNLKGDEICLEARILAVADVVEAMASHRPYRAALGIDAALEEIEKNTGILYDSAAVDACLRLFREKGFQLRRS